MEKRYNVIWIDDEYDKQDAFIDYCKELGIDLYPYKVVSQGIKALDENISFWDAVILDVRVYCDSEDERPSEKGLRKAHDAILRLSVERKKEIPFFISTGQPDLQSDQRFRDGWGDFYIKEKDDDKLIADLKAKVDMQFETQMHHKYSVAFDLLSEKHSEMMRIAKIFEENDFKNTSFFNDLRKLLSWLLVKYCTDHGIGKCYDGDEAVSLSQAKGFLCSLKSTGLIPYYIVKTIESCEYVAQNGSHSKVEGKKDEMNALLVDDHASRGINPYIIPAAFMEFLSIVSWARTLPDTPSEIQDLKERVNEASNSVSVGNDIITGPVSRAEDGSFYCGNCLLPYQYCLDNALEGKSISIHRYKDNTKPNKTMFPYFASQADFKVLD